MGSMQYAFTGAELKRVPITFWLGGGNLWEYHGACGGARQSNYAPPKQ
jgi:hypothetical protein